MSLTNRLKTVARAADAAERLHRQKLLRAYRQSLDEVRGMIANAYSRYGGEWSKMQQYNRLTNLEKSITREVGKLTGRNAVNIKAGMANTYTEVFYRTGFALEKASEAKLGFGLLNPKTIEAAIANPLDRVGFLQRNRDNQARLARQLNEQLTQGLIRGESYEKVARRIKDRMDVGATNTMRIAQTEMHRCHTQGRLDAFSEAADAGVEYKLVWEATLDDVTREDHQDMDGEIADENGLFDLDGMMVEGPGLTGEPAQDINCRCTVRAEIEGYGPEVRRAREQEGERGEIGEYKTYSQWKEGRVNGN